MSGPLIGLLGFAATLALIAVEVPVGIAMGVAGIAGYALLNGFSSTGFILGTAVFDAVSNYGLSVIPLFLMMGIFAARCGLSTDLYAFVNAFVGHFRGGLAIASIGACAGFGAICGSSLATVATITPVALPEMRRYGYDDRLAAGSIAAGGTLGILIPPSIILVVYSLLTQESLGKLFVAAFLPGLLGTVLYALGVVGQTYVDPKLGPAGPRASWRERGRVTLKVWPVLGLFGLVMGGIYLGWFSPTEAAAVGAAGAFVIALVRGALKGGVLGAAAQETIELSGTLFLVMIGAAVFNFFIETTQLPQVLVQSVNSSGLPPLTVILLIIGCYVVLGCFMDALSMILLTVPFVFPVVKALGFDPLWFGIVIVTVTEIGLITPPIGMNLFVISGMDRALTSGVVIKGVIPFIICDLIRVVILVAFPVLATWLPSTMR
ncbi:MAG TPA: TRAP transporter large permease [Pseudolabrys sp.]|nr:TRAP transporter large permease [Pseudolabrys sp.]